MAKKKAKKRRGAGPDADQRRQERLQAKREAREAAERARRRAESRRNALRIALLGALIAAGAWFFFFRVRPPDSIAGHPVQTFSEEGVGRHVAGTVDYETTPPVSGPHAESAAACGTYAEPVPNENYVHSLEHGAVAVLYDPSSADQETVDAIEGIVDDYDEGTLSAPFSDMETPIAVTSWGEMMRLDALDREAVREYIDAFRGNGPEQGRTCPNTSGGHFEVTTSGTPAPGDTQS